MFGERVPRVGASERAQDAHNLVDVESGAELRVEQADPEQSLCGKEGERP